MQRASSAPRPVVQLLRRDPPTPVVFSDAAARRLARILHAIAAERATREVHHAA